jgi:hypothetical protein
MCNDMLQSHLPLILCAHKAKFQAMISRNSSKIPFFVPLWGVRTRKFRIGGYICVKSAFTARIIKLNRQYHRKLGSKTQPLTIH